MEKVAKLSQSERSELFRATAAKKGVVEALIEKDFWVCLVLKAIFESEELKDVLLFKGGTSLSKCYNLINRFSEDIDLILNWQVLGITDEEAWKERSATQQDKFNSHIDALGRNYIAASIVPILEEIMREKTDARMRLDIDSTDGHVVTAHFPVSFTHEYMLDYIKLEIGPRASRIPQEDVEISSHAAEEYPDLFDTKSFRVKTITSERTFWEKATILHQIASADESKPVPPRCSRHYYDLFQMTHSPTKEKALADFALLKSVAEFKSRFYRSPSARYDLAKPGTFKTLPLTQKIKTLEDDYESMKEMIFGTVPEFSEIVKALGRLEDEINSL